MIRVEEKILRALIDQIYIPKSHLQGELTYLGAYLKFFFAICLTDDTANRKF